MIDKDGFYVRADGQIMFIFYEPPDPWWNIITGCRFKCYGGLVSGGSRFNSSAMINMFCHHHYLYNVDGVYMIKCHREKMNIVRPATPEESAPFEAEFLMRTDWTTAGFVSWLRL